MVNEIDVVAGDAVTIKSIRSTSPMNAIKVYLTVIFEGGTEKESLILGNTFTNLDKTQTTYASVSGGYAFPSVVENDVRQVCPTAGTIKKLYVALSADPGDPDEGYRFTVRLNGATVAESLIVTITANATTGNDVAHNLAVVAGDVLTMMIEPLNNPSETPKPHYGMTFLADVDGESIVLGGTTEDLDDTATEYNYISCAGFLAWSAGEAGRYCLGQVCWLAKLYVLLSAAPGVGNKYTFTVRIAAGDSNVVAEVSGTDTTGNSGALVDTVANDEYVTLKVVPDDTPNVVDAYWGLVGSDRAPGWTGKISGVVNPAAIAGVPVADIASVKGVA